MLESGNRLRVHKMKFSSRALHQFLWSVYWVFIKVHQTEAPQLYWRCTSIVLELYFFRVEIPVSSASHPATRSQPASPVPTQLVCFAFALLSIDYFSPIWSLFFYFFPLFSLFCMISLFFCTSLNLNVCRNDDHLGNMLSSLFYWWSLPVHWWYYPVHFFSSAMSTLTHQHTESALCEFFNVHLCKIVKRQTDEVHLLQCAFWNWSAHIPAYLPTSTNQLEA